MTAEGTVGAPTCSSSEAEITISTHLFPIIYMSLVAEEATDSSYRFPHKSNISHYAVTTIGLVAETQRKGTLKRNMFDSAAIKEAVAIFLQHLCSRPRATKGKRICALL
jgi:hypothetical protein